MELGHSLLWRNRSLFSNHHDFCGGGAVPSAGAKTRGVYCLSRYGAGIVEGIYRSVGAISVGIFDNGFDPHDFCRGLRDISTKTVDDDRTAVESGSGYGLRGLPCFGGLATRLVVWHPQQCHLVGGDAVL